MRQKRTNANTKSIWITWIILTSGVGVLISVVYAYYLYETIQDGKTTGFDETETFILDSTSLVDVNKIEHYYGEHTYHVVFGHTDKNEQKIVFVPMTEEHSDITIIDQSETISEQQALQQINEQCERCKVKKINPAIIDDNPLWEITYRDESNRYIFDYLSIYDGSRYERLQFKQMFK